MDQFHRRGGFHSDCRKGFSRSGSYPTQRSAHLRAGFPAGGGCCPAVRRDPAELTLHGPPRRLAEPQNRFSAHPEPVRLCESDPGKRCNLRPRPCRHRQNLPRDGCRPSHAEKASNPPHHPHASGCGGGGGSWFSSRGSKGKDSPIPPPALRRDPRHARSRGGAALPRRGDY